MYKNMIMFKTSLSIHIYVLYIHVLYKAHIENCFNKQVLDPRKIISKKKNTGKMGSGQKEPVF